MSVYGSNKDDHSNWFEMCFTKKVGYGLSTSLWGDSQLASTYFKNRFQIIFSIYQIQDGTVGVVERFVQGRITWDLRWRRLFFVHEEPTVAELFMALQEVQISVNFDM